MYWKQPIPTETLEWDTVTRVVFVEILLHARNEDMKYPETFYHGDKRHFYQLKKGESIFSVKRFCDDIGCTSKNRVLTSLSLLESGKLNIKVNITRKSYGLIIAIENYDEIVKLNINPDINRTSIEHQSDINLTSSNKNVKNVKNVKNEKNIYADFIKMFNEITSRTFRGDSKSERQFSARVKEGYTLENFKIAIRNCFEDDFHKENPQYLTPEFITRVDKLERYVNQKPKYVPRKQFDYRGLPDETLRQIADTPRDEEGLRKIEELIENTRIGNI